MTSQRLTQYDWLDDLCVRFLINLPKADMLDMQRLCFQAEEAHWFYEDFVRPNDKAMPRMSLRDFTLAIFKQCPLLCDHPDEQLSSAFDDFMKYKSIVPVRGAILLSDTMEEVLLVKGWKKSANWGFPKGKINLNEDDLDCAIREVDEETGFDIRAAGLVPLRHEALSITMNTRDQDTKLFIFRGVSKSTVFEAKTRKEISDIQWFRVADLPTNKKKPYHNHHGHGHETDEPSSNQMNGSRFYLVGPFMGPLRRKIREMRERDAAQAAHGKSLPPPPQLDEAVEGFTEDEGAQPQSDYYGHQDQNCGYNEAQQYQYQQQQPQTTQIQSQQYADASRDLLSMISRPSPAASQPQPHPMPYADPSQANAPKASALMAMLQKGGSQAPQPDAPHHHHYADQQGQQGLPGPQNPFYQHQGPPQYAQPHQMPQGIPQGIPQFMQGQGMVQGQGPYNQYGAPQQDLAQYQYQQQQQLQQQQEYEQQQLYSQQQQAQQTQQAQQQVQQQQQQQAQLQQQTNLLALLTQNASVPAAAPSPPPHAYNNQIGQNGNGHNGQAPNPAYQQIHQTQKAPTPTILHPQPLPPTVQKALFARDSLASPDVAAYARGQGHPNMMMPPPPPLPQQQQQQQQQTQQAQPHQQAPLNSHAANLLSFFKTDQQPQAQPQQPQQPQQAPPVQAYQQQIPAQQPPQLQQQLQASRSPAAVFTEPHHPNGPRAQHPGHHHHPYGAHYTGGRQQPLANQGVPDTLNKIMNGNGSVNGADGSSGRPASGSNPFAPNPPQNQHANSLLSMFKQSTTAAPIVPGPEVVAAPAAAPIHPGVTAQQQTMYTTTTTTTTTAPIGSQEAEAAARARGNAGAVEMNSEVNLPFGALSLLSQAKANEPGQPNPAQHPSTYPVPIAELPAGTTVSQTTVLKKQPSYTQPSHQGAQGAVKITGQQMVDSPDHGRPSTHGSGHQYYPPPPEMQQQQQQAHVDVRRPSYTSLSSVAPVDSSAGYPAAAQQLLQQFHKHQQSHPPAQQPQQPPQQADPQQQQKLLSLFGGGQPNVQPQQHQGLSLQQSMQQNLLQQFQRQTSHGHPQAPGSNMSPTAFAGVGSHMPPPGSVSSRGSMDQRAGAANGLALPGISSGIPSGIVSPKTESGASVDGLSGMRRGSSQTPISTEKRDFLLSYLTSRT